tara:strand:- start:13261 stop:13683 length:423 start_codon:yes stop_codon:yes gene_type:complete
MKKNKLLIQTIGVLAAFIFIGCYPVSHVIVGEVKAPILPSEVVIYLEYPEEYEIIARIDASSEFAFRDPTFDFTWQQKMDKIMERLKIGASQLGANGIVIVGTENPTKTYVRNTKDGMTTSQSHYKTAIATAIFVKKSNS